MEETNNQKLLRLLPDLEGIAKDATKADAICARRHKEISAKYCVKMRVEEGCYYVTSGGHEGMFDVMDKACNDIGDIKDKPIRHRIVMAGLAFVRNYHRWHNSLYSACTKRGWTVDDEDEFVFKISKEDLRLDIGGVFEEFEEYRVLSSLERIKVGDAAKVFLEVRARRAKQKAEKK